MGVVLVWKKHFVSIRLVLSLACGCGWLIVSYNKSIRLVAVGGQESLVLWLLLCLIFGWGRGQFCLLNLVFFFFSLGNRIGFFILNIFFFVFCFLFLVFFFFFKVMGLVLYFFVGGVLSNNSIRLMFYWVTNWILTISLTADSMPR